MRNFLRMNTLKELPRMNEHFESMVSLNTLKGLSRLDEHFELLVSFLRISNSKDMFYCNFTFYYLKSRRHKQNKNSKRFNSIECRN